jgi:chorismate dehydratase
MRIGLVESVNARPLSWGMEKLGDHELVFDSPKNLSKMLLNGKLDTALISSVEIIRNRNVLDYSRTCGVCTKESVESILFFKNLKEDYPPSHFSVDSGSKTSVALFELLFFMETNTKAVVVPTDPLQIKQSISENLGSHMLFGDNALSVHWDPNSFEVIDLANWWFKKTNLFFIFALWAFPKSNPIEDSFYLESLDLGLNSIETIIELELEKGKTIRGRAFLNRYLKSVLHYKPEEKHWEGLEYFEKLLAQNHLL